MRSVDCRVRPRAARRCCPQELRGLCDGCIRSIPAVRPLPLREYGDPPSQAAAAAAMLGRMQALQALRLHGFAGGQLTDWLGLGACPPLYGVHTLELSAVMQLNSVGLLRLLDLLPSLTALMVVATEGALPATLGHTLARGSPQLRRLCLWHRNFVKGPGDSYEELMQGVAQLTALQHLTIDESRIVPPRSSPSALDLLASGLGQLRTLEWRAPWTWQDVYAVGAGMAALTQLQLLGPQMGVWPVGTGALERPRLQGLSCCWFPALLELRMPRAVVGCDGWRHALARMPCLRLLEISELKAHEAEAEIGALLPLVSLHELHLTYGVSASQPWLRSLRMLLPGLQRLTFPQLELEAAAAADDGDGGPSQLPRQVRAIAQLDDLFTRTATTPRALTQASGKGPLASIMPEAAADDAPPAPAALAVLAISPGEGGGSTDLVAVLAALPARPLGWLSGLDVKRVPLGEPEQLRVLLSSRLPQVEQVRLVHVRSDVDERHMQAVREGLPTLRCFLHDALLDRGAGAGASA